VQSRSYSASNGIREISLAKRLVEPEIYADRIFYYKDVIENPELLVSLIESTDSTLTDMDCITPWTQWVASKDPGQEDQDDYIFGAQKQSNVSRLASSSSDVRHIYEILTAALLSAGTDYCARLGVELVQPSPLSISKYIKGASMGPHVDYHGESDIQPIMSGVIYLNDDCTGGELEFPEQGIRIKPAAGSIVVFPSVEPYYHQSLPVESGTKYMSPIFWIKRLTN
jgi:predicted 2-oxoglutarate/Fe(II)-dependent dioxygenase YbiX